MKELDWRTHIETLRQLTDPNAVVTASRLRELVGLLNRSEAIFPIRASERRQLIDFLEAALNHPLAEGALRPASMEEVPFGATRDELLTWLAELYGDDDQLERAIATIREAIAIGHDSPAYAMTSVVGWLLRL